MALIVEDGTGLADAEAYASVAFADAYRASYGDANWAAWDAAEATAKEAALRRGAQYLDGAYRPKGVKNNSGQGLNFPRSGLTDADGRAIGYNVLPLAVKQANVEAALRFVQGVLAPDLERGGLVASKNLAGAVVTTFMPGAPGGKTFPVLARLMRPFCRQGLETVRG